MARLQPQGGWRTRATSTRRFTFCSVGGFATMPCRSPTNM